LVREPQIEPRQNASKLGFIDVPVGILVHGFEETLDPAVNFMAKEGDVGLHFLTQHPEDCILLALGLLVVVQCVVREETLRVRFPPRGLP
jgi:hypothetical protein